MSRAIVCVIVAMLCVIITTAWSAYKTERVLAELTTRLKLVELRLGMDLEEWCNECEEAVEGV